MDQDVLGAQGRVVWENCPLSAEERIAAPEFIPDCQQIWAKPLANGSWAVAFANYALKEATVTCGASCFAALGMTSASIRDLWLHEELGVFSEFPSTMAADGGSQVYIFTKNS